MTTINREFETTLLRLSTIALKANYDCPPLIALNNWALEQMTASAAATAPLTQRPARPGANGAAPGGQGSFDEAVLAAVKSSPDGVGIGDLRSILATYKKPNNQIGAALGRLKRKNLIQQRGELWLIKTRGRPAGSGKATTVDKTIGARRTRRARGAAKAGAGNGAAEAGAAQAAAAN